MDNETWKKLYREIRLPQLNPAVVGFNVNLDRIIPVTPAFLHSALPGHPALSALRSRLLHSMQTCTAEEWFVTDRVLYQQFTRIFAGTGTCAIGGQAGIAAVHLALAGVTDLLCIAHAVGPETGKILGNAGVRLLDLGSGNGNPSDITHLVFEYPAGLVPVDGGVVPRNNRFIASPVHGPESVLFPDDAMDAVMSAISRYNRAFLSGYQYLKTDDEFAQAADQIQSLKKSNNRMRVHIECVSVTDDMVIKGFVRHILPAADSTGLNEHELVLLLHTLDPGNPAYGVSGILPPVQLVKGAIMACRMCGLVRLHLHTYGYYVLVLRKDCADPAVSLIALLFASRAAARAAGGNSTDISEPGMDALLQVGEAFGPPVSPGIFSADGYLIIMVPTLIARNITKSSGLGDILSSTAFVADRF